MKKLLKIIRMEFRLTAANKAFVILTILGPFLIAAVTVLPTLLASQGSGLNTSVTRIALLGANPGYVASVAPVFEASKIHVEAVQESPEAMDAAVIAGSWDGYLTVPADLASASALDYVSKNAADFRVLGVLQGVIGQSIVTARLVKAGIAAGDVAALTQPPAFQTRQLTASGEKRNSDFLTVLMTGLVLAMIIYMTTLLYGQAIGRSVLLEKTSKTVEIMLSSVRPMDLLFGKILGKALASILQYGVWVIMSTLVLRLLKPLLGVSVNLSINASMLGWLVLYFLLAFFLYCSLYAALGAAAEDEQHLTQLAWPVIIFLIIPIVMISPIITSPHAPLVVVLSLFPLTSPIVMFLRISVGGVETGEILLSIGLLLVTIAGVIWMSAKIFRVGILMTGKRFKFAEVLKLVRVLGEPMPAADPVLRTPAPRPDGDALLSCLRREGTPRRVHLVELFLDDEVKTAIVKRFGLGDGLDRRAPFAKEKLEIVLQRFLGYDFVRCGLDGVDWTWNRSLVEDTATERRTGGRLFTDEHRGPIGSWEELESYHWPDYTRADTSKLAWYQENLPDDMCIASGGAGHFAEHLTWLMGYETLCFALHDDPALVRAIAAKIDELLTRQLELYLQYDRVKLMWGSDDMGFRTGLLISPADTRELALKGHRRTAARTHEAGRLYLLHSCGNLQDIREDLISDVRIDAKHSFEDTIESVVDWKKKDGHRVSLLGGIDVDFLCRSTQEEVRARVRSTLAACQPGGGYCLGTGNTVANYIPLDNYLAMLDEGRLWTA